MKKALVVVDMQNDFCPGGSLAVNEGDKIVPIINSLMDKFDIVIATQDWHPADHCSFKENGGIWPKHAVQGTNGADLHKDLDTKPIKMILRKGMNKSMDSYSGFFENDKVTSTGLEFFLDDMEIEEVWVCGLARDYCCAYTAIDSKNGGFETFLIEDATRAVDLPEGNAEKMKQQMLDLGIKIVSSRDIC